MITTWRDRPGKVFVEFEIDFLSSGQTIHHDPLQHPDDQRPTETEETRTVTAISCEGEIIPIAELDAIEEHCPHLAAGVWDAIKKESI